MKCKICGGKIIPDKSLLKSGCGCGSLILGVAIIIAGIVICSGLARNRKVIPVAQPTSENKSNLQADKPEQSAPSPKEVEPSDRPAVKAKPDPEAIEKKAEQDLRQAELLIGNNRISPARRRLKELIEKYPDTVAAAKAKQRLESLSDD